MNPTSSPITDGLHVHVHKQWLRTISVSLGRWCFELIRTVKPVREKQGVDRISDYDNGDVQNINLSFIIVFGVGLCI
jgi:hypothetical protein